MKKKTKIILFSIIGVLVIAAVAVGIIFALNSSDSTPTGTVVEGTGEYEWRRSVANIKLGTTDSNKYYSNCDDDHIYDIEFTTVATGSYKTSHKQAYRINYYQDFTSTDDMLVFFVLTDGTNTYTTPTERSHTATGSDSITISASEITDDYYIREIWVQTED